MCFSGNNTPAKANEFALLAEPNAATRSVLTEAIERLGVSVRVCNDECDCTKAMESYRRGLADSGRVVAVIVTVSEALGEQEEVYRLRDRFVGPPLVVTTVPPVDDLAQQALTHAFWGVITKPAQSPEATQVLASAIEEGRRRLRNRDTLLEFRRREASLSNDERLVLQGVCEGKLNKQIARELGVSVRTIEQRRRRVFSKMDVSSAAPLAEQVAVARTIERMHGPQPPTGPAIVREPMMAAPALQHI